MKDTGCNYNRTSALIASATLTLAALSTPANAWVVPTDMSGEGRLGLTAAGEIMDAGSDEASLAFQKEVLPDLTAFLNTQLSEYQKVDPSTMLLDSSQLELKNASDVRVYFVGEGASYHNTLGYTTDGSGTPKSETASVIFPDASTSVSTFDLTDFVKRTGNAPLAPGDFVDLGTLDAGTLLDFFL
ncbi:MAG: hypothetical protein KDM81_21295, partial [Verrucomicrobiae bacterium]|nr:hypothetical protein [Verrucomicrobiae bacterium]